MRKYIYSIYFKKIRVRVDGPAQFKTVFARESPVVLATSEPTHHARAFRIVSVWGSAPEDAS